MNLMQLGNVKAKLELADVANSLITVWFLVSNTELWSVVKNVKPRSKHG